MCCQAGSGWLRDSANLAACLTVATGFWFLIASYGTWEKALGFCHSSRSQYVICAAIVVALTTACCLSQTKSESRSHPALIVAPSASNVNYASRDGQTELTYTVQERYPAERTLRFIEETLQRRKWKPAPAPFFGTH